LAGAEFDVRTVPGGALVAHLITDASGHAEVELQPGTYTVTETFAPGGPYAPLPVLTITMTNFDQGRDMQNVPL
jgi:uncharacterized surface anchored protein